MNDPTKTRPQFNACSTEARRQAALSKARTAELPGESCRHYMGGMIPRKVQFACCVDWVNRMGALGSCMFGNCGHC